MDSISSQQENAILKEQIKFLTDLINNAKRDTSGYGKYSKYKGSQTWKKKPSKSNPGYIHDFRVSQHTSTKQPVSSTAHRAKYSLIFSKEKSVLRNAPDTNTTSVGSVPKTACAKTTSSHSGPVQSSSAVSKIKGCKSSVSKSIAGTLKQTTKQTNKSSMSESLNALDKINSESACVKSSSEMKSSSCKKATLSSLDLDKHSLASLKKLLANKLEAKNARKAKAAVKQVNVSQKVKQVNVAQKTSFNFPDSEPNLSVQKLEKSTVQQEQSNLSRRQSSATSLGTPRENAVSGKHKLSLDSNPTKKGSLVKVKSSDMSKTIGALESVGINRSQLPSKGELAAGLKSTEAKIKELTAELTKLREVAKIVIASPQKVNTKEVKGSNSTQGSYSKHGRRSTSTNSFTCLHHTSDRKSSHSNTQNVARYIVSKYKLNKVGQKKVVNSGSKRVSPVANPKFSGKLKTGSDQSVYNWRKNSKTGVWRYNTGGSLKYSATAGWKRQFSRFNSSNSRHMWIPSWKRQISKRQTTWTKTNRQKFGVGHGYRKGNPYKSDRRKHGLLPKENSNNIKTITVRGVKFQIGKKGKTLQRVNSRGGSPRTAHPMKTVSRVDYRGVTYVETKPGTLEKLSSYQTRIRANQALHKSIHVAVTTSRHKLKKTNRQYCMFYNRFGKCNRGDKCVYIHDPEKVAVCTRFLRGTCKVENCPFSHKVSKDKMPVCSYFLRGLCVRENCPYSHVNVGKDAKICEDFLHGFCPRGENCKEKHILDCPEYVQTGHCSKGKKCKMDHRKRAIKRKASVTQKHGETIHNVKEPLAAQDQSSGPSQQTTTSTVNPSSAPLSEGQTGEDDSSIPFKLRKLPAFISITSSEDTPTEATPKPQGVKKTQELRIKPRL